MLVLETKSPLGVVHFAYQEESGLFAEGASGDFIPFASLMKRLTAAVGVFDPAKLGQANHAWVGFSFKKKLSVLFYEILIDNWSLFILIRETLIVKGIDAFDFLKKMVINRGGLSVLEVLEDFGQKSLALDGAIVFG